MPGAPIKYEGWRGFDWNATMEPAAKLYYAKARGVPFGIFAQSFIHFAPPADVVLPEILSQAAFLYTRETDSLRYLHSLGVQAKEMAFAADAAWAFSLRDDEQVLPFLEKHKLEEGQFLAVTTRRAPAGINQEEDREQQIDFFSKVIVEWIEKTDLPVLLIPETTHSIQLNREYIYEPLPQAIKERVVLDDALWTPEKRFWTPDQALAVLSRARAYLNVDHHGALLALGAGVPCVHVRQPQAGRKAWVYRDIGLEDWLFDLYEQGAEDAGTALLQIHRDYATARERVQKAVRIVRESHSKSMCFMRQLLGL